jgi:hypothetical protein
VAAENSDCLIKRETDDLVLYEKNNHTETKLCIINKNLEIETAITNSNTITKNQFDIILFFFKNAKKIYKIVEEKREQEQNILKEKIKASFTSLYPIYQTNPDKVREKLRTKLSLTNEEEIIIKLELSNQSPTIRSSITKKTNNNNENPIPLLHMYTKYFQTKKQRDDAEKIIEYIKEIINNIALESK